MKNAPPSPTNVKNGIVSVAIATTALISLIGTTLSSSVNAAFENSPKAIVDEAWQIVNREYVDGTFNRVNWQSVRTELLSKNYSTKEEAYSAIRQALQKLDDPYTRFMDPKQYESLTNQTSGELIGVGLKLEINENTELLTIVEPLADSPAFKAGVKPGDQLLAIDGKSTRGMSVEKAAQLIRGKEGSKVNLNISRKGKGKFTLTITRGIIEVATVQYSVKQEGGIKVGYISLSEFSSHAADQMQKAIQKLHDQKVEGFVLDLRGNPGGLLYASIEIAKMWMDKGAIVRTVDRQGDNEEFKANNTALTKLPLAVLVDENSASASEILAGALKDNRRGTIVGGQTFGKALVQSVHSLSDGSGIAVTIAHYYTPNGTDISHKGVTPDIKVDITNGDRIKLVGKKSWVATKDDPQYMKAISILSATRLGNSNPAISSKTKPQ